MANRKQFRRLEKVVAGVMQAQSPRATERRLTLLDRLLEQAKTDEADVDPTLPSPTLKDFLIYATGPAGEAAAFRPGTTGGNLSLVTLVVSLQAQIGTLAHLGANAGFFGTPVTTKPTITGAKGGNVALANLLTGLSGLGLLTDSTT